MNTNLQNKSSEESTSLEVQDSNKKVNSISNVSASALINHKDRYGEKTNISRKQTRLNYPLPKSNNKRPPVVKPLSKEETNKLAQQWVQMLMDQVQETRSRHTLRSAFSE